MSGQDRDRFLRLSVADILAAFNSANLSNPWDATGLRESSGYRASQARASCNLGRHAAGHCQDIKDYRHLIGQLRHDRPRRQGVSRQIGISVLHDHVRTEEIPTPRPLQLYPLPK